MSSPRTEPTAAQLDERVALDLPDEVGFEDAARVLLAVKPDDLRPDEEPEADK